MREIWETLNEYPGFVGAVDGWKSEFAEETGISFDEDVGSWIGSTISAGLVDIDEDSDHLTAVALLGVRDDDAAADFLDIWTDYVSGPGRCRCFSPEHTRRTATWIADTGDQAYALTGDWLVFATDAENVAHDNRPHRRPRRGFTCTSLQIPGGQRGAGRNRGSRLDTWIMKVWPVGSTP